MEYILLTVLMLAIIWIIVYEAKKKRTYASLKAGGPLKAIEAPDLSVAGIKRLKKRCLIQP